MTVLAWDQPGEKTYQGGVDRGVFYPKDGDAVPWNGLTSVEDTSNSELKSFYIDGIRYLNTVVPGNFSGKLQAFTYPEEFDDVVGITKVDGLAYHDQPSKSFNLTYRTKVGNDIDGIDFGYKLHLLYNLVANPDTSAYQTLDDKAAPVEFSWMLSGVPPILPGHRPTAHISIDTRETAEGLVNIVEGILYGTDETDPRFPTLVELAHLFSDFGSLLIVDNEDGTWQAIDLGDDYITMIDSTTFRIDFADATYLDSTTYEISSTNV